MSTSDGDAMPLQTYRAKRDFDRTPEPRGSKVASRARGGAFVVQKHAARHLHYDFRLELDGVLVSWAVPKGPSLDPSVKRLAMHVEDHPLEYGGFEGVIPQGEYGGGTVMVWDKGSWIPRGDPIADYRDGRLKFTLRGKKLKGSWMLIRTRGYESKGDGGRESWLLIKEADEYARAGDGSILETDSVVSGRSLEEIAKGSRKRAERRSSETRDETVRARPAPRKRRQSEKPEAAETQPNDEIAGIKLSNPDKLYFPEAGLTKRDLALYYERVAPWILPHIERRPLSLVRCPDGWTKQCFYQKHADRSVHDAVTRVEVPESTGPATYFSANSAAALVALVQWGVIELHPWAARSPRLERPDRLIFDFDPDASLPWDTLVTAVHELRAVLAEMHLIGFLKTTGGKGLHVVLPIRATLTWEERNPSARAWPTCSCARIRISSSRLQRRTSAKGRSSSTICATPRVRRPLRPTGCGHASGVRSRLPSRGRSSRPMSVSTTSTSAILRDG
jgi:bifunctional non-homologous end joining protein LigD